MIRALARFAEALRGEGLILSPAELLDASHAMAAVGIESRDRLRSALRATLAKHRGQTEIFDREFDRFFAPPRRAGGRGRERRPSTAGGLEGGTRRRDEAGGARAGPPPDRPGTRPAAPGIPGSRGQRPEPRGERWRDRLGVADTSGTSKRGRLRRVRLSPGVPSAAPAPSMRGAATARDARDLDRPMPTARERELAERIPRLIESIRLRRSRRLRRHRRGLLWARRMFRDNLSRGGVPFVLPRRRPRRRRPRVVLLVDVSRSAARATGFFLWMASAFLRPGGRVRIVAFVDRPVDVTHAVEAWMRGRTSDRAGPSRPRPGGVGAGIAPTGVPFAAFLEDVAGLNLLAPSDYGRTFHALLRSRWRPTARDTVWVVLGDGRTNRLEPLPWAFDELTRRARAVLWLVPEARDRWGTGDSALADYVPFVDTLVEAWDLDGLALGLAEVLRRV